MADESSGSGTALKAFLQGKWLGHPVHPLLVHVPTGLWPSALVFDVLRCAGIQPRVMAFTAYYAILVGLIAALLAAPTGLADWWEIKKEKPAWKLGLVHLGLNVLVLALFAVNLWLRSGAAESAGLGTVPLALSCVGTAVLLVSGYLGGRLVYEHGISIARQSKKKWRQLAEAGGARLPPQKGG